MGRFFREEWAVYPVSHGGLLFDLLVVPLLLWRRTRAVAFCVAVLFHLINALWLPIGIFPWLAIAATALFFPPDWPRRVLAACRIRPSRPVAKDSAFAHGSIAISTREMFNREIHEKSFFNAHRSVECIHILEERSQLLPLPSTGRGPG